MALDNLREGIDNAIARLKGIKSPDEAQLEKIRIMRNIFLISLAFLFNFNAFQGLSRLQSSLNRQEGMGVITSSIIYASLVLSCLFIPKPLINFIGYKWTIATSFSGYILYMAANGYAVWGTMITASILVGLCAAPLWTAQCSYFTKYGERYAELNRETKDAVVTRFFGIFFMFFQLSSITGSIISSTVLGQHPTSLPDSDIIMESCGAKDCPWNNISNPNLERPDSNTVWTMVGIYLGIACMAIVIVAIFVNDLPDSLKEKRTGVCKEVLQLAAATVVHCATNLKQVILIPLTMYSGFEQAFYGAEFSKSFVTCSVGIWKVGLVTLPYGIVNSLVSFAGGHVVKYTGRIPIFLAGVAVDLCLQFTLLFWAPRPEEEYVLYILAAMWGFTDGIWQTQINGMYGVVFSKSSEAAFSNYRMWESFGFIIAFAYSSFLCTSIKLYVLTSVLIAGTIGFLVVEWLLKVDQRKIQAAAESSTENGKMGLQNSSSVELQDGATGLENGGIGETREKGELETMKTVDSKV